MYIYLPVTATFGVWRRPTVITTDHQREQTTSTMETTCLLDLEDDDGSSTCSSFTVATVLSCSKNDLSLMHMNVRCTDALNDDDRTVCTVPSMVSSDLYQADRYHKQNSTFSGDEELQRLRFTSSLMDDSFESTTEDDVQENKNGTILSLPPVQMTATHLNLQKTVKKSNVHEPKANNIDSIFRTPAVKENPIEVKASVLKPLEKSMVEASVQTSFTQPVLPVKTPFRAPYDDTVGNSFDQSVGNSLLDSTYESFDELDKEGIKRRKRQSNKFLSVYDDLSAQAIQRTATFQETLRNQKVKDSRVKRISAAFSTAVQSVADGISSHAAANARCDVGGTWQIEDDQPFSGKKRSLAEISGLQNLNRAWGGTHNYVQMQLLAEREEERELYNQVSLG